VLLGDSAFPAEDFKSIDAYDISADIPALKDKVNFRKCDTETKEAAKPLTKECDPIEGASLRTCVGPASRDCAVNFRNWSRGFIGSMYAILKKDLVMDGLKSADIFFDQEKVTVLGIDNRTDQAAKKETTIQDISRVLAEILMRAPTETETLKKHFANKATWKEIEVNTIEQL